MQMATSEIPMVIKCYYEMNNVANRLKSWICV